MKPTRTPLAAMVLLLASAPLSGCEKTTNAGERARPVATASATVSATAPPESPAPESVLEIAGDLRPAQAANLSFKVGGRLASVRVVRGQAVKSGQVLAVLSDAEARAMLAQAEAAVRVARAQAALAEDADKRVGQLATADVVTDSTVVGARLSADAARAGVQQALAAASLARINVSNHVLTAPFAGVVVLVPDGVGETVGPGIPILRLEQLDVLVLRATAAEADLAHLPVGATVSIKTTSGREASGRVRAVLGSLEPVSRRAPVEIEVANPDGLLAAGSYVRAILQQPSNAGAEVAP